jgi:hypothetical protein
MTRIVFEQVASPESEGHVAEKSQTWDVGDVVVRSWRDRLFDWPLELTKGGALWILELHVAF